MFRRFLQSAGKLSAGFVSAQVAATAVVLSDKDLLKKPYWYREVVISVEEAVKDLSVKGFIESKGKLAELEDVFQRIKDINHVEILWRYARLLAEKAQFLHSKKEKLELLHEAEKYVKKALEIEPATGVPGLHKWAAIIYTKLGELEKRTDVDVVKTHFKKAVELDSKDPYAHLLYGMQLFKNKDYKEAVEIFKKAESIKSEFSVANKYYLGAALKELGKKDESIQVLKEAIALPVVYFFEGSAKAEARAILTNYYKLSAREIDVRLN
uniref:Regulator of microtubule dynamics protein 1 (inferred by orthology to a human protein) n=1 Tax=Strongyloides venezuelensis TaxID=75913 RepID=A0A0K0FK85_STRVS